MVANARRPTTLIAVSSGMQPDPLLLVRVPARSA